MIYYSCGEAYRKSAIAPRQHGTSQDPRKERKKQEKRNGVGYRGAEYESSRGGEDKVVLIRMTRAEAEQL